MLQQLHATITSLCSQSSSNPPSQPATPPSTLNLCVESSPSDSPITISHLSCDLLEVEATLESLQSTLSGTLWSCVPLDEHFSLLRDTLATLHSQTTTITQSIQVESSLPSHVACHPDPHAAHPARIPRDSGLDSHRRHRAGDGAARRVASAADATTG